MAEYTNLQDLTGLQVGDVITYTQTVNNVNLSSYKLQIDLKAKDTVHSNYQYFSLDFDTRLADLSSRQYCIYFGDSTTYYQAVDITLNGTHDNNKRIIVAGCGERNTTNLFNGADVSMSSNKIVGATQTRAGYFYKYTTGYYYGASGTFSTDSIYKVLVGNVQVQLGGG